MKSHDVLSLIVWKLRPVHTLWLSSAIAHLADGNNIYVLVTFSLTQAKDLIFSQNQTSKVAKTVTGWQLFGWYSLEQLDLKIFFRADVI